MGGTVSAKTAVYKPISIGLVGNDLDWEFPESETPDVYKPISIGLVGDHNSSIFQRVKTSCLQTDFDRVSWKLTGLATKRLTFYRVYKPISIGLVGNERLRR